MLNRTKCFSIEKFSCSDASSMTARRGEGAGKVLLVLNFSSLKFNHFFSISSRLLPETNHLKRSRKPLSFIHKNFTIERCSNICRFQNINENRKLRLKQIINLLNVSVSTEIHQISPVNKFKSCKSKPPKTVYERKKSENEFSRRLKLKCYERVTKERGA